MAGGEARLHGGAAAHGDGDHPHLRAQALHRRGDAGDEAAARQRHQHRLNVRQVGNDLQADRALARHDGRMIEGRHVCHALFGDQPVDLDLRLVLRPADDPGLGAQRGDGIQLVARHQRRHADDAAHALGGRRMGQRPAVIAGRGGGHALRPLLGRQLQQGVGRAAQLECAGDLPVLVLQMDRHAEPVGQARREIDRRTSDPAFDPAGGGFNVGERHDSHGVTRRRAGAAPSGGRRSDVRRGRRNGQGSPRPSPDCW